MAYPIVDKNEVWLEVGDIVIYNGISYVIEAIIPHLGTTGILTLTDYSDVWSYAVEKEVAE